MSLVSKAMERFAAVAAPIITMSEEPGVPKGQFSGATTT